MKAMTMTAMKKAMTMTAMKKAMAKKVMKAMAKKKSVVGKKASVFKGTKEKTKGGLKKGDLMKSKSGKIVSKKSSANGKKIHAKYLKGWTTAVQKARKALGLKGFVAIKKGTPLYKKAKEIYGH